MNDGVFLGSIPQYVRNSILNHELPNGKWSNIVKALEKGDIKGGVLNGVKFDGAEVKIGSVLSTPIAYYQGDDGEIIDRSDWVVCGFNGAVPEYVKYIMNGT